jgi:RimJ/RimL family protein N-acetyltransferase
MNPLLINIPAELYTERLVLRPPRAGDGPAVNEAVLESLDALRPWMPWATVAPSVGESEAWCRRAQGEFVLRERLPMLMFLRCGATGEAGALVGSSGVPRLDWNVPKFEVGYWVRRRFERQGYVSEAVAAITKFAFETLRAARVEIQADDSNTRSWRVAERAGFVLEGIRRRGARGPEGDLRDTRIYAKTAAD